MMGIIFVLLARMLLTACGGGGGGVYSASGNIENGGNAGSPLPSPGEEITTATALTWGIPGQREDGSPIAVGEIDKYNIYYLNQDTGDSGVIEINDPQQTRYNLSGFESGDYAFAISATDTEGLNSRLSEVIEVSVA